MASYIKISDPNIIDLAAWHQVINVINQHSESLSSITNTTGVAFDPIKDDNDAGWKTVFDIGSQTIKYGKAVMDNTNNTAQTDADYGVYYEESITFPGNSFSVTPAVTATCTSTSNDGSRLGLMNCTISNITTNGFKIRLVYPGVVSGNLKGITVPGGSWKTYISWTAIAG